MSIEEALGELEERFKELGLKPADHNLEDVEDIIVFALNYLGSNLDHVAEMWAEDEANEEEIEIEISGKLMRVRLWYGCTHYIKENQQCSKEAHWVDGSYFTKSWNGEAFCDEHKDQHA